MTKRKKGDSPDFWVFARSYLRVELPTVRKASAKTVEAYRISLESYILFLEKQESLEKHQITFDHFDRQHIKSFMKWMNEVKGYAPKTVGLRLTALKSFLAHAAQEDISLVALAQAAKSIRGPIVPKKAIEFLSNEATSALLAAPGNHTVKERRDRMLLIMLYDTGARVSELSNIKVVDLHLEKPAFVSLLGKGNKPRNVPLMDKTIEHLKVYLAEFHSEKPVGGRCEPLFYSNRDGGRKSLSTDAISTILGKYADRAREDCVGIPDHLTCHTIRKTRAMDLYQEGIPLPIIMRLLGHENMSTTSTFYAFATMKMITDAIESTESLENLKPKHWATESASAVLYSLK